MKFGHPQSLKCLKYVMHLGDWRIRVKNNSCPTWIFGLDTAMMKRLIEPAHLGNPMRHDEKYLLINQGFAGKQRLMPFFNCTNNEVLILAIQSAGVSRGRNGFRKDKSGEHLQSPKKTS